MGEDKKSKVSANSVEFKRGVAAGLRSREDTRNWKAGNELGQELKEEGVSKHLDYENPSKEIPTPLFLKDSAEGQNGNAQDEKDASEE